nr:MAG TPA: hypothetical protein [Caudoviricetes sp.]
MQDWTGIPNFLLLRSGATTSRTRVSNLLCNGFGFPHTRIDSFLFRNCLCDTLHC